MPYATLDMLKQRARISIDDTSQDANLNAKNIQAAREIDFTLKFHGLAVPVTSPVEVLNHLAEINADLAIGYYWEETGPIERMRTGPPMSDQSNALFRRAINNLQALISLMTKGGTVAIA